MKDRLTLPFVDLAENPVLSNVSLQTFLMSSVMILQAPSLAGNALARSRRATSFYQAQLGAAR